MATNRLHAVEIGGGLRIEVDASLCVVLVLGEARHTVTDVDRLREELRQARAVRDEIEERVTEAQRVRAEKGDEAAARMLYRGAAAFQPAPGVEVSFNGEVWRVFLDGGFLFSCDTWAEALAEAASV